MHHKVDMSDPTPSPPAQGDFSEHYVELLRSRLNIGFLVGMVLVPLFAVVDQAVTSQHFHLFLILRLTAAGLLALQGLLNRLRSSQLWQEGLTLSGALTVAAMLEFMLITMGGVGVEYYAGLNLVVIAALVLIPVRLTVAVVISLAILALYLVPLLLLKDPLITPSAILHNTATLASACLLLLMANLMHRRALYRQFLLRAQVQQSQQALEALNQSLEQQVARRTAELTRSEQRYRTLVESNPQLIYALDNQGAFTFVGPKVGRLLGYEPDELLGRYFIELVHPEDHRHCIRAFKAIRDQGQTLGDVEFRAIRADGDHRIFLSYNGPLTDERDKVSGMIGTAVDVTRQRRLADEREKYRAELEQTLEQLEKAAFEIVQGLAGAVEAKDPYTRGHASRVRQISLAMARQAGLGTNELTLLEYAAELHDVGKIGIKGEILNKTGRLDDEEYAHIMQHPAIAENILKDVGLLASVRPLIRAHHERFDGTGYPDGLTGEDIPFLSRIMAVADSFDAMRTNRPYRPPLSLDQTMQELKKGAGSQFDPRMVELFRAACDRHEIEGR